MDDNTFECPHCGATVYPEMTHCPQCGQNMYPDDEDESAIEIETSQASWVPVLGALVIGLMISGGVALLIHFIVSSFVTPPSLGLAGKIFLFLSGPVGAFTGGFVASGIARKPGAWLGSVVALLTLPVLAIFATHWVEINSSFILSPGVIIDGLLTMVAGLAGSWLNYKLYHDVGWKEKWQVRGWEDLLYQDLLRRTRFNGGAADRLIEYEREQDPQANRLKLIQNAIERWERDNR